MEGKRKESGGRGRRVGKEGGARKIERGDDKVWRERETGERKDE